MPTRTSPSGAPTGHTPPQLLMPAFAVDVVIMAIAEGALHGLFVPRGEEPYGDHWADPGWSNRPRGTLDEVPTREKGEKTGVMFGRFGPFRVD